MPLTAKGEKILAHLKEEYGSEKAERVLYAGKNKGAFTGIDSSTRGVLESVLESTSRLAARVDAYASRQDASSLDDKKAALSRGADRYYRLAEEARDRGDGSGYRSNMAAANEYMKAFNQISKRADAEKPAREMTRKEIKAELATAPKSNAFGFPGGKARYEALKLALSEKEDRGDE